MVQTVCPSHWLQHHLRAPAAYLIPSPYYPFQLSFRGRSSGSSPQTIITSLFTWHLTFEVSFPVEVYNGVGIADRRSLYGASVVIAHASRQLDFPLEHAPEASCLFSHGWVLRAESGVQRFCLDWIYVAKAFLSIYKSLYLSHTCDISKWRKSVLIHFCISLPALVSYEIVTVDPSWLTCISAEPIMPFVNVDLYTGKHSINPLLGQLSSNCWHTTLGGSNLQFWPPKSLGPISPPPNKVGIEIDYKLPTTCVLVPFSSTHT